MPWGFLDTQNVNFAEGQTESRLRNMQNRLGINLSEFVTRVDGAMTALNSDADPLVTALTYQTEDDRVEPEYTANKIWQRGAEYTMARPQRAAGRGWMLPLHHNYIALGATQQGLETMTIPRFEGELRTTLQGIQKGRRADVLERFFSRDVLPLDDEGVGTTPGFAGSGSAELSYTGPVPPGVSAGSYSHYERTSNSDLGETIQKHLEWLQFHHGAGPFDLLASVDALESIRQLDGFIDVGSQLIRPGLGTAEALVDADVYVGVLFGVIRVRHAEPQIDGPAFAIYRSYGANNPQNPLAWRTSPIWGPTAYVEDRQLYPLAEAQVEQWYGVGTRNRVGASLISIGGSGGYSPPVVDR